MFKDIFSIQYTFLKFEDVVELDQTIFERFHYALSVNLPSGRKVVLCLILINQFFSSLLE
jgi:hypothetical protein